MGVAGGVAVGAEVKAAGEGFHGAVLECNEGSGRADDTGGGTGDRDGAVRTAGALGWGGGAGSVVEGVWRAGFAEIEALGAAEDVESAARARKAAGGGGEGLVGAWWAPLTAIGAEKGARSAGGPVGGLDGWDEGDGEDGGDEEG